MGIELKVATNGRILIPADVRKALGIENGGSLWLESTETELVLRTKVQRLRNAQAMVQKMRKGKPHMSVDDFIADRRSEYYRENENENEITA
jgi:AbrB family looped-hinge helix DNA binding protein